jgi:hypothetical protein
MQETELYNRDLTGIKEIYQKSKNWEYVVASEFFNSEEGSSMEAFLDAVECSYQIRVKDAKHLEKLTGIDNEDLKKEQNIKPGREITLDLLLLKARYSKYFRSLGTALEEGAKYKDLLKIQPQDYGLPKTWDTGLGRDQYSSMLWAISFEFLINEPGGLMLLPDLRSIAKDLEAPYSVLMDSYKLTNRW